MAIEYTNRKRQKYFLYQGLTKTGKPKYFFSTKLEGVSVNTIPDGYEIYEKPNAQVFLRKIPPQIINPEEIVTVKKGIEKYTQFVQGREFLIDVKNKNIVVYLCEIDSEEFPQKIFFPRYYTPMMQFVLDDVQERNFIVERWCFRGAIDNWVWVGSADLTELVEKYVRHLGKESFFEL